jgi:signal transduction histidine kinase/ligand-binding sensor domain-containing protein
MHRKLIFPACFFIWGVVAAQQYSFVRFTIENGLSNNVVYSTYQDSKGYLWIATHDGLNRYDGYEFKKFLHNPFDKKSLAGNMTIDMTEDAEGRLWILTNTHLHGFDEKDESFERHVLPAGIINHSNQSASKLINGNKRFLLLNLFNGLFVFDKIKKKFRPMAADTGTGEKTDLFNFPFFKDNEGNILIGAGAAKGVLWFDSATITLKRKAPVSYQQIKWQNETVTSVYRNKKNNLVYCTQEGNNFFLVNNKGKKYFLLNRAVAGITVFIESIQEDEQGDIWVGYGNRLFKYLPDADSVTDLSGSLYNTSIGDNFIIKNICIDNFSNLWVGLYEAGLLKASIRKSLFPNFSINQTRDYKLPYSSIYGLIKNTDETVIVRYFGTQMATILDAPNKKIVTKEFKLNPLDSITIKKLFPQFAGLKASMPFYKYFNASTRLTFNNGQFGLYKDREQNFWAVNFNDFKRIKDDLTFNTGDHINCFYEGDSTTFWVGTDGSGLLELNYKTGRLKKILPDELNPQSISSSYVNGIIPYQKKGLWLATRYGLNYFDFQSRQFKLFSEKNGLCNNTIYTMEKDADGKLWLGTSNGLSCYDPHTNEFTNYSKNNGLVNSEYNRNGTIALANGWILMGGTEGIDVIIPDSIKYRRGIEKKQTPLLITSFKSPDSTFYSFADPIRLTHRQNNIAISFAALDFTQPYNNKYLWKLDPVDKKWEYAIGKHEVNYAGLLPGNYTFKIKAAGANGIWNDKETSFSFIITSPWWQSWWAAVAIIVLGIAIVAGILRLYYYRKFKKQLEKQKALLEKQQAIEKERTRIATDMHDDLGAGLSRIKFLSETIGIKKQKQEPIEDEVSSIRDYSHQMIDKMGEIVWALNEKNDSLSDLLAYTRAYAVEYLSQNGIKATVETDEQFLNLFVSGEFRRNIYLTVKEALHNIVKHSRATDVSICVETNKQLFISIHDNGTGFDEKNIRPFSNGITNMKKRIESLGGKLDIKDTDGSTVTFTVPLP